MIIPGFSNYDITTDGVVTHVATGKVIKPHIIKVRGNVYKRVSIVDNSGHIRAHSILALLALTYLGKPLHNGIVRAKDGDNLNTVLDNVVCTMQAEIARELWRTGSLKDRRCRDHCFDEDSIEMVYNAMLAYDRPVRMTELSNDLDVAYATVRYSVETLRKRNKVRKTAGGFEVIR